MNAVEIKNLKKKLGNFELSIDSLNIKKGFITGFIGRNGAGKTTTIKLIMDMLFPDSGDIKIFNKSLRENEVELKSEIAYVGSDCGYPINLKLKKLKALLPMFYPTFDDALYNKYIKEFNLDENLKYENLSSGQQRQFQLCMALSHRPKLLLMDEPTVNLDPVVRNKFLEILSDHLVTDEISIFYSSHITSDLEKSADYIYFIDNGKILLSGEKEELLSSHQIIKGSLELLSKQTTENLIGLTKGKFGFEALTKDYQTSFEIFGNEVIYEKPTLEDLMIYYSKDFKVVV